MGKPTGSPGNGGGGGGNGRGNKEDTTQSDPHVGTEFVDTMICGDEDDVVFALGGDDMIFGGLGDDMLDGGEGSDTYVVNGYEGVDTYSDSGTGDGDYDRIIAGSNDTVIYMSQFGATSGIEEINADGHTGVNIRGSDSSDNLDFSSVGLFGIDYIHGMNGNDNIVGSQGGDSIFGGVGNDDLDGAGGNDVLNGGYGSDNLTGGAGSDTFMLTNINDAGDTITDFTSGEDQIDMTFITANGDYAGYELIKKGQNTLIQVTLNDGSTNDVATLEGVDASSLSDADFLLA